MELVGVELDSSITAHSIIGSTSVVENCSMSGTEDTAINRAWSLLLNIVNM